MDKLSIRKEFIKKRNNIDKEIREEKSQLITDKIIKSDIYEKADTIFVFLTMGSEVNTDYLIKDAYLKNKKVAMPYAKKGTREMYFIETKKYEDMESFIKSEYGAIEPPYIEENILKADDKTLLIVPGNVFSLDGYRVGYGGGYYDTFIENNTTLGNIGVCFSEQMTKEVPTESFDQQLDFLFTDEKVYEFKK